MAQWPTHNLKHDSRLIDSIDGMALRVSVLWPVSISGIGRASHNAMDRCDSGAGLGYGNRIGQLDEVTGENKVSTAFAVSGFENKTNTMM